MPSRKIEALKEAAIQKAKDSALRVNKALENMIKQGQIISFKSVAQSANVSTAYLYKQSDLRSRIENLRDQQKQRPSNKQIPLASDNSKAVIIANLRKENKRLRVEIDKLSKINESLTGQLYKLQGANDLTERLRLENEKLTQELKRLQLYANLDKTVSQKLTPITKVLDKKSEIPELIQYKLESLKVKVNSSLTKLILASNEQEIIEAILSVEQYVQHHSIRNINGLVIQAIREKWSPSASLQKAASHNLKIQPVETKISYSDSNEEFLSLAELSEISNIFMDDNSND